MKKLLKKLIFLGLVLFFSYLVYLNYLIKSTFSSEIHESDKIAQINYSIEKYPKEIVNMILLVEDQSFFQHWGVDFKEIVRVFYGYFLEDKPIRGASTITQQLARNMYNTIGFDKTYTRKLKELITAIKIEQTYTKSEIMELYLNSVYFGHGRYGVQSAAMFYFGKKAEEISLAEAATIIGVLPAPAYYSPIRYPEKAKLRKKKKSK